MPCVPARISVRVIEPNRERAREIAEELPSCRVYHTDGVDPDFVEQLFRVLLTETHRIEVAESREEPAPLKEAGTDSRSELDTVACRIDHVVVAVQNVADATMFFSGMGFRIEQTDDTSVVTAEAGGVKVADGLMNLREDSNLSGSGGHIAPR